MQTPRAVCVFCGSSSGDDTAYVDLARDLGAHLADEEVELVYGGGSVGLMGELADACLTADGSVVGIIPTALFTRDVTHRGVTELVEVASMHERKARMYDRSDGFIVLPGGLGTLEELAEVATWTQLGLHAKPVVLLDPHGFWDPLVAQLDAMVARGFLRASHRPLVLSATSPAEAVALIASYVPPTLEKWIDRSDR